VIADHDSDRVAWKAGRRDHIAVAGQVRAEERLVAAIAVRAVAVHDEREPPGGRACVAHRTLAHLRHAGSERVGIAAGFVEAPAAERRRGRIPDFDGQLATAARIVPHRERAHADGERTSVKRVVGHDHYLAATFIAE
jgi:hypothetical protein